MKNNKFILLIVLSAILLSCKNGANEEQGKTPLEELEQADNLLSQLADKPQHYTAPSDTVTIVTGEKGTIIHVDPDRLETVDGSPLGKNLDIELVEMVDMGSLMFNNTQTVSNGEIIETGGAYYLNMTSDGKQLKMKSGKGLEMEFPNISKKGMEVFMGKRDSLGQVNWTATQTDFKPKDIPDAKKPKTSPDRIIKVRINNVQTEVTLSEDEYKKYLLHNKDYLNRLKIYEEAMEQFEYQRKTYKAIEVMDFGLINIDRFLDDPSPKTDIQLIVKNKELTGARIYALFNDINSIATAYYWKGEYEKPSFEGVPTGKELKIIALSAKDEVPYVFETTINTSKAKSVQIDFKETTHEEIKRMAQELRKID